MSAAVRMLAGLIAGLAFGVAAASSSAVWLRAIAGVIEPVGTIFINAIRMTVIPLIVSKLIAGIASASGVGAVRRIGGTAFLIFVITAGAASTFSLLVGKPLMARLQIDPGVVATLQKDAAGKQASARGALPGVAQWFEDLVPPNAFKAAADGAMLPLIVFSLAFGLALTRVGALRREAALHFFQATADAMLILVRWILVTAPVGVFALAAPLAARLGLAAAGALFYYVALVALGCIAFALLVVYPGAVLGGKVSLRQFARAAAPAQAIAFSSRSSLASLPVMIESARTQLNMSDDVAGLFLPLAAAMFRAGSAVGLTMGALFLSRLYGIELTAAAMLSIGLTVVVTSLGSPGVPSGSILIIVPILMAAGIPVEGAGILLGIDTLPDMFRTTTNITADMAAAAVVARQAGKAAMVQDQGQHGDSQQPSL